MIVKNTTFTWNYFTGFLTIVMLWIWKFITLTNNPTKELKKKPISVNYHFTRVCNYSCGFCFHTQKTSHVVSLEDAKKGLRLLKESGMEKVNFAGGEPFLKAKFLGMLVQYCKETLKLNVSIVSNSSKITEKWFETYGQYLDILAVSCDSFDEKTNERIGRIDQNGKGNHIKSIKNAKELCEKYGVKFKLNSVVNAFNCNEDMNVFIEELKPFRWKVFQVLLLEGENSGPEAIRNAKGFLISTKQFNDFLQRHDQQKCLVPESNDKMQNSYLILDEYMRFLNCTTNGKLPSESILEVGVEQALKQSGWDNEMFAARGGVYDWAKPTSTDACGSSCDPKMEW